MPAKPEPEPETLNNNAHDINNIFKVFYETVNPTINFGNTTNRKACEILIKKFGYESVKAMAEYAVKNQGRKFCPVITTPYQLKEKIGQLIIFKGKNDTIKTL